MSKRPYPRHPPCAIECRCDGNQVYALIGCDYMTGVVGFGDTLPDALRALAGELEREVGQEPVKAMPDGRLSEIVAAEWLRTHELSGETLKIITQPPGRRS